MKWSGAGTNTGHQVAAFLADGVPGVPELVRTLEGGLWSFHGKKRLTVTPWIDGVRAAETGLTTEQWTEYGVLLRRVHEAEPPERLRNALPRRSPVDARIPALAEQLQTRLTTHEPEDDLEAELAAVWREHQDTITGLIHVRPPEPSGGPRVVCHADPHLGNVLVDGRVHLIDWDDVVLAPREQDLMFLLGGMGSLGPTTPEELAAFFTGYGDVEPDPDAVTYYRHVRAVEDVVLWADQALTGPDREDSLTILRGVLGPGGLAQLANEGVG
ncbi:phosphotransferase enzyme family protein [Kribbella swartbergensis]